MFLALSAVCVAFLCVVMFVWSKRTRDQNELARHSITAEDLHLLLASNRDTLLFDVRQPLDLLAYSEVIPGARRVPPQEVLDGTSVIPKDKETVVYCTCPGEKTSREVLRQALSLHFSNIKFLKGGLAAWKAKGYPVEPYRDVFHLYVPSSAK
ncbi:MAG TPA: rhodanese-like domain-containing protein [Candidatus Eremiobacteraceae bacterium]|nr:rhodanese-like domain-containing protein [Candidatus Eremiobacteraceae bacterium]